MIKSHPFIPRRSVAHSGAHAGALARAALGVALGALGLGAIGLGCGGRTDELGATGSETHFLLECSETCAPGLDCIDGVCTRSCSGDESCAGLNTAAVCSAAPAEPEAGVCDVECASAADCAMLGTGYRCLQGSCRAAALGSHAEGLSAALPGDVDMIEIRTVGSNVPGAGSTCDYRRFMGAYFIDLDARQISAAYCNRGRRDDLYEREVVQLPLSEEDVDYLLAAYHELHVLTDDAYCDPYPGFTSVDVTVGGSRFSYAGSLHAGCPSHVGREQAVGDSSAFRSVLAEFINLRQLGLPLESATAR